MQSREIKYSFTQHYLIAVSLLVILSSTTFYFLTTALKSSETTAYIINISGKQRTLSQHIALYSQLYLSSFYQKNSRKSIEIQTVLENTANEMRLENEKLSSGEIYPEKKIPLSSTLHNLYFDKNHLKDRVNAYTALAVKLIHSKSRTEAEVISNKIIKSSNALMGDLNMAVLYSQIEGDSNISNVQTMLLVVWIITLFTLLLEIIFIFQPMAHKMATLFQKIVWHEHNLQEEIKIRTNSLTIANEKLAHLASHDPLTGLKNRLNMEKELQELIDHQNIYKSSYAVVMLDIDWFKKINDTYGHDAGDFVLCELAEIFLDTVRPQDSVYRAGGEEFVIIFNRITKEQVIAKCEKIRQRIQEHHFDYNDLTFTITISIGIYHPETILVNSVSEALKLADNALYEAKRTGRNKVAVVDSFLENTE
ncbi:MAG: GGDEF domain-containing protein [Sulfuricurvum sp.]|uniref:GGDEF domain-containing protein n=1 Tax=Sulfuricurvum sp. TaxID=2025608 RepID=UPI0026382C79|nr:GGDEF domain-containing protein [Sulfuricurvum sp.]MDD2368317.1 GGDEF domain-containing protein [Sulfuricurvum sp.]MDD2950593.1 GGDEF domain-containing protein [Sulfuricurvum sp.]MDD5118869.1 GGDEF domain-containing protein [Sulfuricurvum sp.]